MQQTTNLGLELYEATDNANLLDGYNSSMRKIDAHEGTQDGLITLAQSTANSATAAATAADGKADSALDAAAVADGKAVSAASAASQALGQLNGVNVQMITTSDFNTWFELPSDSYIDTNFEYEVEGVAFTTETHATLVIYIHGRTRVLASADFDHFHPLFKLKNWKDTEISDTSVASMDQYTFPVELHLSSSNPDVIRFVIYSGGGSFTPPQWGLTISACMVLQLVPKV